MRSKIEAVFDARKFSHVSFSDNELYVVDYTERTDSIRAVEIHNSKPTDIDSLIIHNTVGLHIASTIFLPQCFLDENGNEPKQCECIMSPANLTQDSWIVFIEIKDCKPKNASNYHKEAKEKILANVQLFRDKGILDSSKVVYGVVSFPRKDKTNFHNHLIKASEWKQIRDSHKIMIKGTNEFIVKNHESII